MGSEKYSNVIVEEMLKKSGILPVAKYTEGSVILRGVFAPRCPWNLVRLYSIIMFLNYLDVFKEILVDFCKNFIFLCDRDLVPGVKYGEKSVMFCAYVSVSL